MGIASTSSSTQVVGKPSGISLSKFLSRLIWFCVLPLLLLATYLSLNHVRLIQAERDLTAQNLAVNFAQALDQDLNARIHGLQMVALSPGVDDPARRQDLYRDAQRFQQIFGSHVVFADLDMQMLWNTRVPFNTDLPRLPRPQGRSAVVTALETGQPAIGDTFLGPIAKQPLVAIAVPVVREGKSAFFMLTTLETRQFQQRIEQISLPLGWSMQVIDSKGAVIARLAPPQPDAVSDENSPARFMARSSASPWSVQVEIPQDIYRMPLITGGATLLLALLAATLTSLVGGKLASRRLSKSVASLVSTPGAPSSMQDIHEIEAVRETIHQLNTDLSATLQAIPDLLFDIDQNGTYHAIWAQNTALLAQQREILMGHTVREMLPADAADTIMSALLEADEKGCSFGKSIHLDLADGIHWFELSISMKTRGAGAESRFMVLSRDITERMQAELELQRNEAKLRAIADNVDLVMFLKDLNGRYLYVNRQYEKLFHVTNSRIQGQTDHDIFPATLADAFIRNDKKVIRSGQTFEVEEQVQQDDGVHTYTSVKIPVRDASGTLYAVCGIATDITKRKQTEVELRIAATAFESREGMMVTDAHGVILKVNRAFTDITGYTAEDAVGQTPKLLQSGRHNAEFYKDMWETVNRTGGWQGEVWDQRKNGEEYQKWLIISAVKDAEGRVSHYVGTHYDITDRKRAEETINQLAFFDPLTHLPNRTLLHDRLKQAMTASNRNGAFGAVLFIDLDDFKTLNDTLGHDKGDLLLQEVARRLVACIREGDTVARLGGDEFVVMLGNLTMNLQEAASQTEVIGKKILTALNQKYHLGTVDHRNTASIGATLFSGDATPIEELLKQADLAMYKSKNSGRNTLRFFDPAMQSVVMKRAALEIDLHEGIQEKQFLLYYQAQIAEGQLTGSEVLVRWQHPQRGMVSPADFIPLAEEIGLILPLGLWVLETACAQLAVWATQPRMAHLTVAVNVSAHQFRQPDFVEQVLTVLKQTGANPCRLKLELTESLLVDNVQNTIEKMMQLKAGGVGFSLDDFGTGYSSLAYLKRLPLDQLKIDQSFVRDVLTDPNDAAIAKTIVALAHSLGLGVIAEGVETAAQRDFLAQAGCHAYQGYFFSRPLPLEGFEAFAQSLLPSASD